MSGDFARAPEAADPEGKAMRCLAEAWNAFLELDQCGQCPDDIADFRKAINDAQRILLARNLTSG